MGPIVLSYAAVAAPERRRRTAEPPRNLHGRIVHSLGRRILSGAVRPGEAVTSHLLVPASRTALREAMKVLAAKGLIELRPKTGTRVRPRDAWNLLDPDVPHLATFQRDPRGGLLKNLTEVRRILEPAAAALAASRATTANVVAIERALGDMTTALSEERVDLERFVEADSRFHVEILRAAANPLLAQVSRAVFAALVVSFRTTSQLPGSARASLPRHRAILNAIRAKRPASARRAMLQLVERTAEQLDAMATQSLRKRAR